MRYTIELTSRISKGSKYMKPVMEEFMVQQQYGIKWNLKQSPTKKRSKPFLRMKRRQIIFYKLQIL